ncbi:MAG TPA: kelch repeat-containing protein, partial [Thermoplasmata archaeon]|nr:kelch repeat-containing protein [Thermoplasmata archaeon]
MLRSRGAEGWRSAFAPAVLLVLLLAAAPGGAAPSGPHPPRGPDLPIEPAVPGPWTNLSTAGGPAPPPTVGGALANDSHDLEDLWFGGSNGSGPGASGLTWIFQNGSWTNLTATLPLAPPARSFAAMAYDPEVAGVVLFGGLGDPTYLNDTWVWKDGAWTNFTAPAGRAPPARTESGMTYDLASGELLLFGGIGSSGPLADSWEFSAGRWNPLTPYASPPAACCGAMAYDPVSSAAILVLSPAGTRTLDTWSFATGTW